jgi:hypothetical protein
VAVDGFEMLQEGMENEAIVASGIFYYESNNISESDLEFRHIVKEPDYEQCDYNGVKKIYGLINEEAQNQHLGYLVTQGGRCIAFPNVFQHRVKPFQLIDPTKPGRRRILVFFLVDPTVRVLSTAQVAPLQRDWLSRSHPLTQKLPAEVSAAGFGANIVSG